MISLKIEQIYASPVFLSGLATLILTTKQVGLLDHYYKVHLERILRLHQSTPVPVVFFLAGRLPIQAQLHLKMISLFGIICRLSDGNNFLSKVATSFFSSFPTQRTKSWFNGLRKIFVIYNLPHPLHWLRGRPSKESVKEVAKASVLKYWLKLLREQASKLTSTMYLKTDFLGLTRCHPIFSYCPPSSWEV